MAGQQRYEKLLLLLCSIEWKLLLFNGTANATAQIGEAVPGGCVSYKKIALIGGGITSAATAAFLRRLEATQDHRCHDKCSGDTHWPACAHALHIDVFEATSRLGGRLEHISVPGGFQELGAGLLDSSNKYMKEFVDMYKADRVEPKDVSEAPKNTHSALPELDRRTVDVVFNGEVLTDFNFYCAILIKKAASLVKAYWCKVYDMLEGISSGSLLDFFGFFQNVQPALAKRRTFESGLDMLKALHLSHLPFWKLWSIVRYLVLPPGRPVVESVVLSMYTQNSSLQSLAGLVALVGAFGENVGDLPPLQNVVQHLFQKFASRVYLKCTVEKVFQHTTATLGGGQTQGYTVEASKCEQAISQRLREQIYDAVVIATPSDKLEVYRQTASGVHTLLSIPRFHFQNVFVTVVQAGSIKKGGGLVRANSMVVSTPDHAQEIGTFFVSQCGFIVQELSRSVLCSIKSGRELQNEDLLDLFENIRAVERRKWAAYPMMYTFSSSPAKDEPSYSTAATNFELLPGLFYPNAFEGLFSCMEGQAVAARNVAGLVMNWLDSKRVLARGDGDTVSALAFDS